MIRTALFTMILICSAAVVGAATFTPTPYFADANVDVLTRTVANQMVGRDLFGTPYATAVVGNVDVYDRFPYIESRFFQIVSDPSWNRLLLGEIGRNPVAYDGSGNAFGAFDAPRGLSSDAFGRVYVADSGNNRVVVLSVVSEFDRIDLVPRFTIDGLSRPYDVAYSDGGTPFDGSDDRLFVANSGRNEVRMYALNGDEASFVDAIGALGSGVARFAGPMAIAVGHHEGVHTADVYVADAHNARLVHLLDAGQALVWAGSVKHDLGPVTALDTDHWGNVYATAPHVGSVAKFTSSLLSVASFSGESNRPRSFHVPFANVTDHRTGEKTRAGQGSGILVEEWDGKGGLRLLNLDVDMKDAAVVKGEGAAFSVTLTDHASVTAEIRDTRSGEVIARHETGVLGSGPHTVQFSAGDYLAPFEPGTYRMTVIAASTYDKGRTSETEMDIAMSSAGGPALPARLTQLGNTPNPFNPTTVIRFSVPSGPNRAYDLKIYDVAGRLVRSLAAGQIGSGVHQETWDGRSDQGGFVGSGIYLYRVKVGPESFTGKMVMVK